MLAARSAKPKLTLNMSIPSATSPTTPRPTLSLKTPLTPLRSPIISSLNMSPRSPMFPSSPTTLNTKFNQRAFSTPSILQTQAQTQPQQPQQQFPTYAYANNSSSRSILKKTTPAMASTGVGAAARRHLQFSEKPLVYCVTPIEEDDYYGSYRKLSREERRWMVRPLS